MHGRPQKFRGSWYTSVFVHYYPANVGWETRDHRHELNYAVPPQWDADLYTTTTTTTKGTPTANNNNNNKETPLRMVAAGMKEPACQNDWCGSEIAIPFGYGPSIEGEWIGPYGDIQPLIRSTTSTHHQSQGSNEL